MVKIKFLLGKLLQTKILLMLLTSPYQLQGQEFQSWNSLGFDFALGKKMTLETKELISFQPADQFSISFLQTSLALNYKINSDFSIEGGDQLNIIPSSTRAVRNRIYFRGNYVWRFSEIVKSAHGLQLEFHSANELRYSQRIILINGLSTRKRYTPLNLRPSVSYWLYYNIGGDPIQYYDIKGDKSIMQTANGFHRGRLYLSLNSKINDKINIGLYFMHQKEFNFLTDEYREINVLNPNTGNITRDFNNYNVLGLSLNFNIGKEDQ